MHEARAQGYVLQVTPHGSHWPPDAASTGGQTVGVGTLWFRLGVEQSDGGTRWLTAWLPVPHWVSSRRMREDLALMDLGGLPLWCLPSLMSALEGE